MTENNENNEQVIPDSPLGRDEEVQETEVQETEEQETETQEAQQTREDSDRIQLSREEYDQILADASRYRTIENNPGLGASAQVFNPYIESDFTGKPIEVTTPDQRDALCKEHGVTYDSYQYSLVHKKKREDPLSQVGFDTWAKEMKSENLI